MGRTILTHPGTIPEGSGFSSSRNDRTDGSEVGVRFETKTSWERRYCKWCLKYKPERCHYCRVCNLCFLRMDHHCPWVYDCIGFGNHKYFVLLLIYAELNLLHANITMFDTVWWSTRVDVPCSAESLRTGAVGRVSRPRSSMSRSSLFCISSLSLFTCSRFACNCSLFFFKFSSGVVSRSAGVDRLVSVSPYS